MIASASRAPPLPALPPPEPTNRKSSRVTWCPWQEDAPGRAGEASRYSVRFGLVRGAGASSKPRVSG